MSANPTSFRLPSAYTIPETIFHNGEEIPLPPQIRDNIRMLFNGLLDAHQAIGSLKTQLSAVSATTTTITQTVVSSSSSSVPAPPFMVLQQVNSTITIGFAGAQNTFVEATAGASGITITLVTARGVTTQFIILKKVDNSMGVVTINAFSGPPQETIDGTDFGGTYVLTNYNQYVVIMSDGTNWNIIANN